VKRPVSLKPPWLLPLALLSASLAAPAYANWFHDSGMNLNRNIGSAPSPTPKDIRENRTPAYPLIARSLNRQGTVGLVVSLTERGTVSGAVVEHTSGASSLDEAAIQYVKANWVYKPTDNNPRPPRSLVGVEVTFKLN
jgi:TonB family protein